MVELNRFERMSEKKILAYLKFETGLTTSEAIDLYQEVIDLGGIDTEDKLEMVVIGFMLCKKLKGE